MVAPPRQARCRSGHAVAQGVLASIHGAQGSAPCLRHQTVLGITVPCDPLTEVHQEPPGLRWDDPACR